MRKSFLIYQYFVELLELLYSAIFLNLYGKMVQGGDKLVDDNDRIHDKKIFCKNRIPVKFNNSINSRSSESKYGSNVNNNIETSLYSDSINMKDLKDVLNSDVKDLKDSDDESDDESDGNDRDLAEAVYNWNNDFSKFCYVCQSPSKNKCSKCSRVNYCNRYFCIHFHSFCINYKYYI